MGTWEGAGQSNEWYTPRHIFDALGERFDLDVAAPKTGGPHVPADRWLTIEDNGLATTWSGFVWMNPPFGGRMGLTPWLVKFFQHGNGIALTPDRTSAPWWKFAAHRADAALFTYGKPKFIRPDHTVGKSPGHGVTLWAAGDRALQALLRANGTLGACLIPAQEARTA
jgi:hypothetical protein